MQTSNISRKIIAKGIIRGTLAATVGSAVFAVGEAVTLVIKNWHDPLGESFLPVIGAIFIGATIVSTPFAMFGAVWLAFDFYRRSGQNGLSGNSTFLRGASVGFLIGAGLCIVFIGLYFRRGDWMFILIEAALAILICSTTAGKTALLLQKDISKLVNG